jgi:predicted LPLAT superfamily acyltransferase
MSVITYQALLNLAQQRCSPNYYYYAKRYHACFTGIYQHDIQLANQIIDRVINHNTAHGICSMFR